MKSIKTNPNSAKWPDKGKIVNKLYCILLTTLELAWLYFFRKKPDMKFIILVSNLKEISPSVFSWKKRMSSLSGRMNIARVNIECFTGCKRIKWRISFVLGYLRMIIWKISTAISIKHRILATFNIKKKLNSDSLYAFNHNVFFSYSETCLNQTSTNFYVWNSPRFGLYRLN